MLREAEEERDSLQRWLRLKLGDGSPVELGTPTGTLPTAAQPTLSPYKHSAQSLPRSTALAAAVPTSPADRLLHA